jgi:hypothetical protein
MEALGMRKTRTSEKAESYNLKLLKKRARKVGKRYKMNQQPLNQDEIQIIHQMVKDIIDIPNLAKAMRAAEK